MGAACSNQAAENEIKSKESEITKLQAQEKALKAKFDAKTAQLNEVSKSLSVTVIPRSLDELNFLGTRLKAVASFPQN